MKKLLTILVTFCICLTLCISTACSSQETSNEENKGNGIVYTISDQTKQEVVDNIVNIKDYELYGEQQYNGDYSSLNLVVNQNLIKFIRRLNEQIEEKYYAFNINGKDYEYRPNADGYIMEEIKDNAPYHIAENFKSVAVRYKDKLLDAEFDETKNCYVAIDNSNNFPIMLEYYFENDVFVKFHCYYEYQDEQISDCVEYTFIFKDVSEIVLPT